MKPFPTARDASLSIWASSVASVARRRGVMPRAASPAHLIAAEPAAAPVDLDDPMVEATSAYVAGIADLREEPPHLRALDVASALTADIEGRFGVAAEPSRGLSEAEKSALYHQLAEARATGNRAKEAATLKSLKQFGPLDAGWIASVAQYVWYYKLRGKDPAYRSWKTDGGGLLEYSVINWKIPADGTVALVADWGTGQSDAIRILRSIAAHQPDAIIHLGDIYYSGTEEECMVHVLQPVLQFALDRDGFRIPVFSLAGNHDYYSGGTSYLTLLERLNAYDPAARQPASYFSLRSEDGAWQFLAMDTGYYDHDMLAGAVHGGHAARLRDDEIAWHRHKLDTFDGATVLLSHHQLCSAYDAIGDPKQPTDPSYSPRLLAPFAPYLDRIAGWFWGHEHSLVLFEPFAGVRRPRCVGHGAIPVDTQRSIYERKYNMPFENVRLEAHDGWYDHGYELLRLGGRERPMVVEYYTLANGGDPLHPTLLHREELPWTGR